MIDEYRWFMWDSNGPVWWPAIADIAWCRSLVFVFPSCSKLMEQDLLVTSIASKITTHDSMSLQMLQAVDIKNRPTLFTSKFHTPVRTWNSFWVRSTCLCCPCLSRKWRGLGNLAACYGRFQRHEPGCSNFKTWDATATALAAASMSLLHHIMLW